MPEVFSCISGISFDLRAALLNAAYLWSDCQRCMVYLSCSPFHHFSRAFSSAFLRLSYAFPTLQMHSSFSNLHACSFSFAYSSSATFQSWSFFFKASFSQPYFHCLTFIWQNPKYWLWSCLLDWLWGGDGVFKESRINRRFSLMHAQALLSIWYELRGLRLLGLIAYCYGENARRE